MCVTDGGRLVLCCAVLSALRFPRGLQLRAQQPLVAAETQPSTLINPATAASSHLLDKHLKQPC